jgi:PAS domain S-box-containing protein
MKYTAFYIGGVEGEERSLLHLNAAAHKCGLRLQPFLSADACLTTARQDAAEDICPILLIANAARKDAAQSLRSLHTHFHEAHLLFLSPTAEKHALQSQPLGLLGAQWSSISLDQPHADRAIESLLQHLVQKKRFQTTITKASQQIALAQPYDVVERQRLLFAEQHAANIVRLLADSLIVTNTDGIIEYVNESTTTLLGYAEEELLGHPIVNFLTGETSSHGFTLNQLIREGVVKNHSLTYRAKTGECIPMSFSGSVMRDSEERIVGIVGVAKDMRESRRLLQKERELAATAAAAAASEKERAEELKSAYDRLKETQSMLIQAEKMSAFGTMGAGLAHEVNNPLMGIINYVRYCLKHLPQDDVIYPTLVKAEREARRASDIMTSLLTFARADTEGREQYCLADISVLLDRTLQLLDYRIMKVGATIIKAYTANNPPIWLRVTLTQQVFVNLITNALDAMEQSALKELAFRVHTKGIHMAIEISDTGSGIPTDHLARVFDPFFTTKDPGRGTGLGLSICRTIIQEQGGSICCESQTEQGTTFTILLPLAKKEGTAASCGNRE